MKNNPTVQREDENRGVKRKILILILLLLLLLLFSAITAATGGFHAFARALGLNTGDYTDGADKNVSGSSSVTGTGGASSITISDGLVFDEPDSKDKSEEDGDSLTIGDISAKTTGQLATNKNVEGFDMTVIVRPDVPRSGDVPNLSGDGEQQKSDTVSKPPVTSNPENDSDKNQNSSSSSDTNTSSSANPDSSSNPNSSTIPNPDSSSNPENSSAPDSSSKPSTDEDSDSGSSNTIHVREVELDKTTLSLHVNASAQLGVTIRPGNAKKKKVTWSSNAPEIASVDASGLISALAPGEAVITVKSADRGITAECRVTVTIPVSGIKLSKTALPLERGQTERITATVEPENATNQAVLWSTQDSSIAAVDENGSVTAVGKGSTVITATTEDGQFSERCTVSVGVSLRKVILSETKLTLDKGSTGKLTAKVEPEDTTDPYAFRWSSSDSKIAEVDSQGNIRAVAGGKAIITVTARDSVSASCEITVNVPASGITLSKTALSLVKGSRERIQATVTPESASNQKVLWKSSNEAVAVVDENGNITAINGGSAEITAQALDGGFTAQCSVTVLVPVGGVSLSTDEMTLIKGKTGQLTAKILPENASIQAVTWKSHSPEIATVDENGLVTAKQGGDTVITVTSKENAQTAQCLIHVRVPVEGVTLDKNKLTIIKAQSEQLTATITPADATTKELLWKSSNEAAAVVDENGNITAINGGSAEITAQTLDGGFTAVCSVTVHVPVGGISLNTDETTLIKGKTGQLTAKILPENASIQAVTWKSYSPEIATVDENGLVTALAGGQAVITVTSKENFQTALCLVHVRVPAAGVTLNKNELTLVKGSSERVLATVSPKDATDKKVLWKSSNPAVATVKEDGTITAVEGGSAVITAQTNDGGFIAEGNIKIHVLVDGIVLNTNEATVIKGKTEQLTAKIMPENATIRDLQWESSHSEIATVDENGLVTAKQGGDTVITVTTKENAQTAQCLIHVRVPVEGVTLNKNKLTIIKTKSEPLIATIAPADATTPGVVWESSDESVATVTETGQVIACKAGTTTITATTKDGDFTSSCEITVIVPVTSFTLNKTESTILKGEWDRLVPILLPEDVTDTAVSWESSNKAIATVDEKGNVKAIAGGNATITATTHDGGFTAKCLVHVRIPVTGIAFEKEAYRLARGKMLLPVILFAPEDATDRELIWDSSDESVAKVNRNGEVTGLHEGQTTLTATSHDGRFTTSCTVTVWHAVTGVTLNKTESTIIKTQSEQLTATITPADATIKELLWVSSDAAVASVNESGLVTAHKAGSAVITVKTKDGDFTAACKITVRVPATGITLNKAETTIIKTQSEKLVATILPDDATDTALVWTSSDEAIAKVSAEGNVTAIAGGRATITATTHDGGFTARCVVNVRVPVTGVTLDKPTLRLARGTGATLHAAIAPDDATDKAITWASSNPAVATVTQNGEITALHEGETTITVTTRDGSFTASCTVTVWHAVTGVTLNKTESTIIKTQSEQLTATITPADATIKELLWISSDAAVASVNESGLVTAHKAGSAVITVKTKDGDFTAECKITVRVPATGITLNKAETTIIKTQSEKLIATILPDDATDTALVWTSSDEAIARVNAEGNVTAIAGGRATITATTHDGGFTARCVVNVRVPVTGVTLDRSTLALARGTGATLHAAIAPGDATDKAVTWASSNPAAATVTQNGEITALHEGVTTITVTTRDGSFIASCTVTVWHAVTGVTLDRSSLALNRGADGRLNATILPGDATNKGVTWESSNNAVATVSSGTVHAVSAGTAVITVRTQEGGKTASCTVTVSVPVTGITLNKNSMALSRGTSGSLTATVAPGDATNRSVSWSTSNAGVATVSGGTVYAVGAGSATITATTADGNKQATCTVTVSVPVTGITLNQGSLALSRGASESLTATVAPGDATNRSVSWSTSNAGVATVSNGTVYAAGAGTATITATTADGNKQATCTVTVSVPVTGITLNQGSLALSRGASGSLTATVAPGDATNRSVSWSTSNAGVATVSGGTVYAAGAGSATITATTADGNKQATCTVTVTVPVTGISLNKSTAEFKEGETTTLSATVAPWDASNKDVTWSTSNGTIATVSGGLVTGVKAGTATITASCGGYNASCTVTIKSKLAYKVIPPNPKNEWVSSSKVEDNSISWENKVKEEDSGSVMHYQTATIQFDTPLTNARVCFSAKGGTVGYSTVKLKASGKDLNGNSASWSSSAYGWAYGSTNLDFNVGVLKTTSIDFYSGRNNNADPAITISNIVIYSDEYPSGVALNDMTGHL